MRRSILPLLFVGALACDPTKDLVTGGNAGSVGDTGSGDGAVRPNGDSDDTGSNSNSGGDDTGENGADTGEIDLTDSDDDVAGRQIDNLGYPGFEAGGEVWQAGLTFTLFFGDAESADD